jgi:hypothetical protein
LYYACPENEASKFFLLKSVDEGKEIHSISLFIRCIPVTFPQWLFAIEKQGSVLLGGESPSLPLKATLVPSRASSHQATNSASVHTAIFAGSFSRL